MTVVSAAGSGTLGSMDEYTAYDAYTRGMDLLRRGEPHQAAVALATAKRHEPEKGSIREALGRAHLASGDYERAATEFGKAVELAPTDHYAHYGLARALQRLGRGEDARRHYRLARCFGSTLVSASELA